MRTFTIPQKLDGIIGWHSFFHLNPEEQHRTLITFAGNLKSGGVLMLTVGPESGEVVGHVGSDEVYHCSLSREKYYQILHSQGFNGIDFIVEDPLCNYATVILAKMN